MGVNWTPETLIYRSSLWNAQGEPLSLSWRKHVNWDERPDLEPAPTDLSGCELMEKVDGSTLIVSHHKGVLISRTRGTVDASKLDNGDEIALLKERYPKAFVELDNVPGITRLYEWVSPRNQIVIPYPEADIYLTGIVQHSDYSYWSQDMLDWIAKEMGVKRPRRYSFNTIPEMLTAVTDFRGVEGVCVYYNRGQTYRKHKGAAYLLAHAFRDNITESRILDYFFEYGRPDMPAFLSRLESDFDYESMSRARELVTAICDAYNRVTSRYNLMEGLVGPLRIIERRVAAGVIQATYGDVWKGAAFHLLDNRPLDDKTVRKLMEYTLDGHQSP